MLVPFEKINNTSRVWIYQANRPFNLAEADIISRGLSAFTESWLVHGSPMQASFCLKYDQFIILAADEDLNAASGCSIDDSVRTLRNLGAELKIDFFDRTLVAFKKGEQIFTIPAPDLKTKLSDGTWDSDTLMFNNVVNTKEDLTQKWLIRAGASWLKRYLPRQTVAG
ncbi:MAG TPA: hypothetical protein VFZ52_10095 [Chryseolinea sp.]